MRNYAEGNDWQLSKYGDFRSGTEGERGGGGGGGGGGGRYPDFPYLIGKGRLDTYASSRTALVFFCFLFFFLFSFNFIYEVAEHISVTIEKERERETNRKKERETERERESKGAWRCDQISKEVRT